ncbi:MAG: TrkH family potassium uptake protein [Deltaproteobacteria bacterium]|nr:TrkH family potassium uptake protein [Deltaproteobacteria bacterium]
MQTRTILYILSVILILLGGVMAVPVLLALLDRGPDLLALALTSGSALVLGVTGWLATRRTRERRWLSYRDGYVTTVAGWLLASGTGAMPFFLYAHLGVADPAWAPAAPPGTPLCALPVETLHPAREFCSITDALFESVSGFTTTGASVIRAGLWDGLDRPTSDGRPALPRGLLLWRSLIQWLGGMGILVLAVSILALAGVGGLHLMNAEVPGPTAGRLSPRIADTARMLWKVYAIISLAQVAALLAGGMDLFNAVCHTCTTMATGGFSTLARSATDMTPYTQWVLVLFMFVAGANFALHWALLFRRSFSYHRDGEFRLYGAVVLVATGFLVLSLLGLGHAWGFGETLRHACFQVVSILTTTGYASADFARWAPDAQLLLLLLMLIGGCAGSTGGGVKVIRLEVTLRTALRELLRLAQPRAVSPIRSGHQVVKESMVSEMLAVVILFGALFVLSSLLLAGLGMDVLSAVSAVAACIGNVGPGLGDVGPMASFHGVPAAGKWVLMFDMIAGRLEILTVLVLLSPRFWIR